MSKKNAIIKSINEILNLEFTCKETEEEINCGECPFDFDSMRDCGLAIIRERANMIKLEVESGDKDSEQDKCPECSLPSTHPSGLCRDCFQAILEMKEI